MPVPVEIARALRRAIARADIERQRAERADEIAERHERQLLTASPVLRESHEKMATLHRQVQRQHATAAAMHAAHARRLGGLARTPERHYALPSFMASVAEAANADSAAVTLFGPGLVETLTVVSDTTARAAQELEFTLNQGPARDTMTGRRAIRVAGTALAHRWPNYGPAVERLGVGAIAAVPVQPAGVPLGALTLFGPRPDHDPDNLQLVANTVAAMLLPDEDRDDPGQGPLLLEADHRAVVHQATGMISGRHNCSIPDALALIRARAFADDRSTEQIASDIVERRLNLI